MIHRSRLTRFINKKKIIIKLMILLILLLFFIVWIDGQIRPVVKTVAEYRIKVIAMQTVNQAIIAELAKNPVNYEKIITLSNDPTGRVTSLETNIKNINQIKADVTNVVLNKISTLDGQELKIPVGSFFKSQLFSGRGPKLTFKLIPAAMIETKIASSFKAAGINQTLHQIILNVNVIVTAIIPGYSTTVVVPCDYVIAETVIVGIVPDNYTYIDDNESSTLGKLNDYGSNGKNSRTNQANN